MTREEMLAKVNAKKQQFFNSVEYKNKQMDSDFKEWVAKIRKRIPKLLDILEAFELGYGTAVDPSDFKNFSCRVNPATIGFYTVGLNITLGEVNSFGIAEPFTYEPQLSVFINLFREELIIAPSRCRFAVKLDEVSYETLKKYLVYKRDETPVVWTNLKRIADEVDDFIEKAERYFESL